MTNREIAERILADSETLKNRSPNTLSVKFICTGASALIAEIEALENQIRQLSTHAEEVVP